jgi:hypothetical protein
VVTTDNTNAMQEALQTAVKRMNGNAAAATGISDPIGLLVSILPKLMQNNGDKDDLVDKIDGVQKETGAARAEILAVRKQLHRIYKLQEDTLAELRELQRQQIALGQAVLDLADQMAKIEILEDPRDDGGRDGRGAAAASARPARAGRTSRK